MEKEILRDNTNINKYLINIINEYAILDVNKLISIIPKTRTQKISIPKYSLLDMLIKVNQKGYICSGKS